MLKKISLHAGSLVICNGAKLDFLKKKKLKIQNSKKWSSVAIIFVFLNLPHTKITALFSITSQIVPRPTYLFNFSSFFLIQRFNFFRPFISHVEMNFNRAHQPTYPHQNRRFRHGSPSHSLPNVLSPITQIRIIRLGLCKWV